MSYDQFNMIFIIGLVFAGLFLALSIVLFFVLKVPSVLGYLTGATERKAISEIRKGSMNEHSVAKASVPSPTNEISGTAKLAKKRSHANMQGVTTASLKLSRDETKAQKKTASSHVDYSPTDVLDPLSQRADTPPSVAETSVLETMQAPVAETVVLPEQELFGGSTVFDNSYISQTTVLGEETAVLNEQAVNMDSFRIVAEIVLFVSSEIIV